MSMKFLKKLRFTLIIITAGFFTAGFAVECFAQKVLTLQDAIDIALKRGYNMKSLNLSLIQAEQNRLAAKYRFRTNADLTLNAPSWSERVTSVAVPNALPVYNSVGSMLMQGQFDINQPLPTDGTITLSSKAYQSDESNYLAQTDETLKRKDFLTSLSINLSQPLFTYNRLKTGLKRAELNYENSSLSLKRSELDIIYNVTQSFYNLYRSSKSLEIYTETVAQKKSAYDLAKLKFDAGLIPEVEALEMEVDLSGAQSTLLENESNLKRIKEQFKQLIGLDMNDDVTLETSLIYTDFAVDLDTAVQKGLSNRPELREDEIDVELQKINLKEVDARSEFNAKLSAFYDLTGISDSGLPYNSSSQDLFDSSWDDLQRRPRNRGIALTLNIPVFDWGVNKAEIQGAKADIKRSELQKEEQVKTITNDVKDVVRRVETARNRMEVLKKRQDVAVRTYEITLERFNNGEITSQDLALNNNRLSEAKLTYLDSFIAYQLAVADLKRKTLWDFEKNEPFK